MLLGSCARPGGTVAPPPRCGGDGSGTGVDQRRGTVGRSHRQHLPHQPHRWTRADPTHADPAGARRGEEGAVRTLARPREARREGPASSPVGSGLVWRAAGRWCAGATDFWARGWRWLDCGRACVCIGSSARARGAPRERLWPFSSTRTLACMGRCVWADARGGEGRHPHVCVWLVVSRGVWRAGGCGRVLCLPVCASFSVRAALGRQALRP